MEILNKIDKLRRERGWSVNYMAMEAMLTQSTVNNLYKRKNEPRISTLRALCNAFGITLSEFFAEEGGADVEGAEPTGESLLYEINLLVDKLTDEQKTALLQFLRSIC